MPQSDPSFQQPSPLALTYFSPSPLISRNLARYAGDDVKANDVFHDPEISKIEAPTNPYLEERRARERDMIETIPEEMLIFQEYDSSEDQESMPKTASYKDKLALFNARRRGAGDDGRTQPPAFPPAPK